LACPLHVGDVTLNELMDGPELLVTCNVLVMVHPPLEMVTEYVVLNVRPVALGPFPPAGDQV
jgi:hypothetical protein